VAVYSSRYKSRQRRRAWKLASTRSWRRLIIRMIREGLFDEIPPERARPRVDVPPDYHREFWRAKAARNRDIYWVEV
jgi:hypothetical protein